MLRLVTKLLLFGVLLLAAYWAANGDYCLLEHATGASEVDSGMLYLGLGFQVISLMAIYTMINGDFWRLIGSDLLRPIWKIGLSTVPFFLLIFSHDPIANALYHAGIDKIATIKSMDAALKQCRLPTIACTTCD